MYWTSASHDIMSEHTMKTYSLSAAIKWCETMGWGYDVKYPTHYRWHVKKNYADNFKWKGDPKEEHAYD